VSVRSKKKFQSLCAEVTSQRNIRFGELFGLGGRKLKDLINVLQAVRVTVERKIAERDQQSSYILQSKVWSSLESWSAKEGMSDKWRNEAIWTSRWHV
jgi:hypothetical protein